MHAGLMAAVASYALVVAPAAIATEAPAPVATVPAGVPATVGGIGPISRVLSLESERKATSEELATISGTIQLTSETIESLDAEIAALATDRDAIRTAMIAAAASQKDIERDIASTEARIGALTGDEARIKASLRARRGLLAEVLGALERMGRKPPPALLVKPDDALGSVRSAILLGAVVPGIRTQTERLVADLQSLSKVKSDIGVEKDRFVAAMTRQKEEEARLSRLFAEKEKLEAGNRERRQAASERAAELADKALGLQDLISSLEIEAESARAAEEAARRTAEAKRVADAAQAAIAAKAEAERRAASLDARSPLSPDERGGDKGPETRTAALAPAPAPGDISTPAPDEQTYDIASLRRDMARIEPSAAFSTMKGRLSAPVSGVVEAAYGSDDGIGRPASGTTFSARAGDVVTAPADGQVLYSGPFRSYGQLLILDAGDGYHVVLAGMSQIDVAVGQFVLSGEPVAVMGARRLASTAAADFGDAEPRLYVEFRKDGKPVDPTPWWTDGPTGRTRNDS